MPLVIEDGSIIPLSDSWVTRVDFISYASSRGIEIPDVEATDTLLRKAADYINLHEDNLKGRKVSELQNMSYPRYDLMFDGFYVESTIIPNIVKSAQMEIALTLNDGIDLFSQVPKSLAVEKKVKVEGAVEVEYEVGNFNNTPATIVNFSKGQVLLKRLLRTSNMAFSLVRV